MIFQIQNRAGFRKLLLTLTAVFMFLSCAATAYADETSFSDTLWSNGYYDSSLGDMAGRRLYVYGLTDHYGEEAEQMRDEQIDLASEKPIYRLELAELLYRLCGESVPSAEIPFTDVPEECAEAVAWLYSTGVTRGISNELFGTGEVTRAQFLTMLSRLLSWEADLFGVSWGDLQYEDRLIALAREKGLIPAGVSVNGLTHGDVYLILFSLAEQQYPEKLLPVRAEMSRPYKVFLDVASYLDAVEQIKLALKFAPAKIQVRFSQSCPGVDLKAFQEKYQAESCPFTAIINTSGNSNYNFCRESYFRFTLSFQNYAPAYLAEIDAADWLRCYEDTAYSRRLSEFWSAEIQPLAAQSIGDYTKASAAQDLACRLASYDWSEYEAIQNQGSGIHPQTHTITGFLEGSIVCDGYAKAYQWICRCLGLDCFVVYGQGNGDSHAWNKVKVDGTWYNADVCWKDTGEGDYYFLKSDQHFQWNRHSFRDDYVLNVFASGKDYQAW